LKFNHLRKSAGKVQEDQVASAKSSATFLLQIAFGEEFFNPAGAVAGKIKQQNGDELPRRISAEQKLGESHC